MKGTLKPPEIPEKDQSPLVEQLLAFIEHQSIIIQQLKDEIARLKNQPPRPTIKPSRLGKSKKHTSKSSRNKRPGSKKRSKTAHLKIHKTDPIEPDEIPTGSQFRYYKDFVVSPCDGVCLEQTLYLRSLR
jgi:DNA replication initiation complex subunit (GINS family)